ncbi:MAG: hypothetical protein QW705_04655 [Zestosphaera sp.]
MSCSGLMADAGSNDALMMELLKTIREWSRGNLSKYGWLMREPESYEWWGGFGDPFEISVSAVLVQLSRWEVVDKALKRLKERGLLDPRSLSEASQEEVEGLIRGVGFYRSKARVLRAFSRLVVERGGWRSFVDRDLSSIRDDVLSLKGVGPETADTMLLFACNKPVLPVSRLARRVLSRIGLDVPKNYLKAQKSLEERVPKSLENYKMLHAALVSIAKTYCRIKKPACSECPLKTLCNYCRGR